jgi:uncharacterized membrane protein YeaQ/YmgE (transglycosylase-associated protein family)
MPIPPLVAMTVGNVTLDPGGCISWIVAGMVAGWLAGLIVRGRGFGCIGDIVLGLLGAVVGLFVLSLLPASTFAGQYHFLGTIVIAFVGALILAAIGRLIGGGSGRRRYYDWHRQNWNR